MAGGAILLVVSAVVGALIVGGHGESQTTRTRAVDLRVDHTVNALLSGIPQAANSLGQPTAPVTLQVFTDLECLTAKRWFVSLLPTIIRDFVRTNVVRIQFRSLKTDTIESKVFYMQQTAALAAGAQDKLWNYVEVFYREQRREYTPYVTEDYLDGIAEQISGLRLAQWNADRVVQRAQRVLTDDRTARALGFHDTPGFLVGLTGGKLKKLTGREVIIYERYQFYRAPSGKLVPIPRGWMRPVSLVDARDLSRVVRELI